MSDVEEPPTKMSKYEEYLDPEGEECLEEGQEEWLSEGVLTDDDYVPTIEQETVTEVNETAQDELMQSLDDSDTIQTTTVIGHAHVNKEEIRQGNVGQNIEEQLNNLDNTNNGDEMPEDLDSFLIRRTDSHVQENRVKEGNGNVSKKHQDDGNDTDDLLRMLGDDEQKVKKKTYKVIKSDKIQDPGSSDDDDFIYERSQIKTLKLAKNALIKRTATKAVPEDMSDGDDETQSSDDGSTMKRMFDTQNKKTPSSAIKAEPKKKIIKHVVQINRSQKPEPKSNTSMTSQKSKSYQNSSKVEIKTPAPFKPLDKSNSKFDSKSEKHSTLKNEDFDEIIDGEEFLEDDDIDLDEEEFGEESENSQSKQRIMKPEMMDEEVPSDGDSRSEDGSLYDELPSSDSDDLDDRFTLDIRAERAGNYLPLLGTKARELLVAERRRVSSRVEALRQSLSALTDSARRQADQLRAAAMALAEIDDTLRAA